jgi:hypothetical protein
MSTTTSTALNPFANMSPGIKSEEIKAEGYLKIAIIGKQKTGKSWFAATAPQPIRYYDWDDRAESLEGKSGMYISSAPALTMLDVETDLSVMKANKIKGLPLPATVVHDTVTFMKYAMENEIRRQAPNNTNLFRGIKVGNSTAVFVGQGWDVVNGIQRYMKYLIAEYTCLGINQIYVFHERDEKDKAESTAEKTAYTGMLTIDPQYLLETLSLLNEIYHIRVDATKPNQTKYVVECRPTADITASTTMMLDYTEPPDIMAMIAKHKAKRAEADAKKALVLASTNHK